MLLSHLDNDGVRTVQMTDAKNQSVSNTTSELRRRRLRLTGFVKNEENSGPNLREAAAFLII